MAGFEVFIEGRIVEYSANGSYGIHPEVPEGIANLVCPSMIDEREPSGQVELCKRA